MKCPNCNKQMEKLGESKMRSCGNSECHILTVIMQERITKPEQQQDKNEIT